MTRRDKWGGWDDSSDQPLPRTLLDQWEGDWRGTDPVDMTGREIEPGMWLVKTYQSGRSCNLEIRRVREVRKYGSDPSKPERVFLDDSKVPLAYPGRCLIVDWDPDTEKIRGL